MTEQTNSCGFSRLRATTRNRPHIISKFSRTVEANLTLCRRGAGSDIHEQAPPDGTSPPPRTSPQTPRPSGDAQLHPPQSLLLRGRERAELRRENATEHRLILAFFYLTMNYIVQVNLALGVSDSINP